MLETEVKFLLTDPASMRRRLHQAGAVSTGSVFETNHRYDDADGRLLAAQCLLRLRRDRRNRLTVKQPHPDGSHQFKTHEEMEIDVSDFDTASRILAALGFRRVQIYEKHRETFILGSTEICLDEMPYGHFVEIEGTPETIPAVAMRLGLAWQRRILANYLQIFETIRHALELPFTDVTFAHFENVQADLVPLIQPFEAESRP
ncbi:MAG: class IV adenylate cyclase [Deltaproteobacteria bacterium]|jgi:adenylate cyclase class 2|nr:class IV adenylate cyclase [Deltaproteobacteria bacterium]